MLACTGSLYQMQAACQFPLLAVLQYCSCVIPAALVSEASHMLAHAQSFNARLSSALVLAVSVWAWHDQERNVLLHTTAAAARLVHSLPGVTPCWSLWTNCFPLHPPSCAIACVSTHNASHVHSAHSAQQPFRSCTQGAPLSLETTRHSRPTGSQS